MKKASHQKKTGQIASKKTTKTRSESTARRTVFRKKSPRERHNLNIEAEVWIASQDLCYNEEGCSVSDLVNDLLKDHLTEKGWWGKDGRIEMVV